MNLPNLSLWVRRSSPVLLALFIMVTLAVGAIILQSNFPSITVPVRPALLSSACPNTSSLNTTLTPPSLAGTLAFNCGGAAAFSVGGAGIVTPAFTVTTTPSTGVSTSLGYAVHGTGCASFSTLTTGVAVTFSAAVAYDYCLSYTGFPVSGGTINSFILTWA